MRRKRARAVLEKAVKPALRKFATQAAAAVAPGAKMLGARGTAARIGELRAVGVVETVTGKRVTGWVSVPADDPPTRVRLCLDGVEAMATYATAWPTDAAPTKPSLVRHSWRQVRYFSFRVAGLWRYTGQDAKLSVRVGRRALPITKHGTYLLANPPGRQSPRQLRAKLAAGYVFSQDGRLQVSKKFDRDWQRDVLDLYDQVRRIVREVHGHDVFVIYGTLLGLVREGGVIAHDVDFDAAFISRQTDGPSAAQELAQIATTLTANGLDAHLMHTAIHVHGSDRPTVRIDVFHLYFDGQGRLRFPFGIAGTSDYTTADWAGTTEVDFLGGRVLTPVGAERLVEYIYGVDWREPKPGFNWNRDRTAAAREGILDQATHSRGYWANFYAHHRGPEDCSSFGAAIQARPDTPDTIIDIGCGNGRDALYFAGAGRTVVGLDAAEAGLAAAREQAAASRYDHRASFHAVDVAQSDDLHAVLADAVEAAGGEPVLFYLRFFLHAISEKAQEDLLRTIEKAARPGDLFAAEFRTTKDRRRAKSHGHHFRRYQDGPAFGAMLRESYGYTLLDEAEGTGLAPWGDEDPYLYRVVAAHD